jgi:hypothetical protein
MEDLSPGTLNIWLDLKQGSLGIVLLGLRKDKKVAISVSAVLKAVGDPCGLSQSLNYMVWASMNCIGQLAYHQFVGDPSKPVHLEPLDPRWNPLRVMPGDLMSRICNEAANNETFQAHAERVLTHFVSLINAEQMKSLMDAGEDPEAVDLLRHMLVCLGGSLALLLDEDKKTLRGVVGELAILNS